MEYQEDDFLLLSGIQHFAFCRRQWALECDVVEFQRSETGITLYGQEGLYQVFPIEYKRGMPKKLTQMNFN